MIISRDIRKRLFDIILSSEAPFHFFDYDKGGYIPFLQEIWDLKFMPSEDHRFGDAERDIYQHTVNNDDWELDYLFIDRLKLLEDNDVFIRFLETFLKPNYQASPESSFAYLEAFNRLLKSDNVALVTIGYEGDYPIFSLAELDDIDHPLDLPRNTIPFYVFNDLRFRIKSSYHNSLTTHHLHNKPEKFFFLVQNSGWNDYGFVTGYSLNLRNGDRTIMIGYVKIGVTDHDDTADVLPNEFTQLDTQFCSLGQTIGYYEKLSEESGHYFNSILYALKDCAFFSEIADNFEQSNLFRQSLTRTDEAERLYRQAKPVMKGVNLNYLYRFNYHFRPKYSTEGIDIDFDFNSTAPLPNRIYAIIGKNGTGKTQLITTLPLQISKGETNYFTPQVPIFSKVIAVSYSTFDSFELPKKTSEFNYVYCGLRDEKGDLRNERGHILKFHRTWKRIQELKRLKTWRKILANFLDSPVLDLFIKVNPHDQEFYFDQKGFKSAQTYLSSGQSIILYIISEIVANIRLDSLLLFDEPETHLHPNAVTQLMNAIADLVHEFESYCIIATHSPLIIQDLFSKNVFILERDESTATIRRIGRESFGENLSTLTEEVFGNRSIPKHYKQVIDELVIKHKDYDKVLGIMQEGNLPLSLNVRLYLKGQIASL